MVREDSDDIDLLLYLLPLDGVTAIRDYLDGQFLCLLLGTDGFLDYSEAALSQFDVAEDEVFLLLALQRLPHYQLHLLLHVI